MEAANTVLKELGISKKDAIREYALLNASQKAAEFTQECEAFEKNYGVSFKKFEVELRSKEEDFEREDDYLAWKFATEGVSFWRKKVSQLKQEE